MDTTGAMSCQELVELVTEYLEGALPEPAQQRFEQHLLSCAHCFTYLDQLRITIDALGALTEDELSREARDDLLDAFRAWKRAGSLER